MVPFAEALQVFDAVVVAVHDVVALVCVGAAFFARVGADCLAFEVVELQADESA